MSDVKPQSPEKREFIAKSKTFWNPGKTQAWQDMGVDLVIDRREGYFIWDMDGRRLIDLHLNGGTYNIGHRHPELIEILNRGTQRFDMGNHHFPSQARTALAERLAEICGGDLHYTMYASGGAEAIDIALKTARHATQRRKIVSIVNAYHGHTGLAVAAGADRFKKIFLSDQPEDFVHVPFNDLTAMEDALKGNDVAALIMETIPATYGFPMPLPGYLKDVKKLCERYGALYIADEVQTGLMRCGEMWGYQRYGIVPDMVVTGKGISGGMYPIACVVVREPYAGWLTQDGFAHMSTMGGAELGCLVAMKTLEILQRPPVKPMVNYISETFRNGLHEIMKLYPDFFVGIRQCGVVMGLEFDFPEGAKPVMRHLYENGVWAIFSTLDPRVLQFKPGVLMTADLCHEVLERVERSVGLAYAECMGRGRGKARAA
ncbi:class-III pyridoxal-phosphate-dependent aminotransferase [Mesorhizobium sp. 10J20-29]|jgi:acetylornithine/succinyldiaminopimelate/putrescine aminotransferase